MMKKAIFLMAVSFLGSIYSVPLTAATVPTLPDQIFQLRVDTSSLAGTSGSIDFQLNPGPNTYQSATVTVSGFQGASSTSQGKTGGATGGPLPNVLTINNTQVLNEDLESIVFGNSMSLKLDFSGVAVNTPGSSNPQSGSVFTLGLFSDAAATMPVLTYDPEGAIFREIINPGGQFITQVTSPQASLVPEPSCAALVSLAGFGLIALRARRKERRAKSAMVA
jgi:hypothetical protein